MSCRRNERRIALFVEGDLSPRKSRRLEEHLVSCEHCGELLRGLEESQACLKTLAEEALPESVLREVRQAVRGGIEKETETPRFHANWAWALAGAVAVLILGLVVFNQTEAPVPEPVAEIDVAPESPPQVEPVPPTEVERLAESEPIPEPEVQVAAAAPSPEKQIGEDLVVKIVTDNSDVVIYWLVEQNGG